jgi:hypothetical protein
MDEATFVWVFTFLALHRKNNKIENSNKIHATLVIKNNKNYFNDDM